MAIGRDKQIGKDEYENAVGNEDVRRRFPDIDRSEKESVASGSECDDRASMPPQPRMKSRSKQYAQECIHHDFAKNRDLMKIDRKDLAVPNRVDDVQNEPTNIAKRAFCTRPWQGTPDSFPRDALWKASVSHPKCILPAHSFGSSCSRSSEPKSKGQRTQLRQVLSHRMTAHGPNAKCRPAPEMSAVGGRPDLRRTSQIRRE